MGQSDSVNAADINESRELYALEPVQRRQNSKIVTVIVDEQIQFEVDITDEEGEKTCGWLLSEVSRKYTSILSMMQRDEIRNHQKNKSTFKSHFKNQKDIRLPRQKRRYIVALKTKEVREGVDCWLNQYERSISILRDRMVLIAHFARLNVQTGVNLTEKREMKIDDFEQMRIIGRGGFSKVVLARKKDTGRLYAIKILQKDQLRDQHSVRQIMSERKMLAQLDHPFLIKLHWAFQNTHQLFFVMDVCTGGEIFLHLLQHRRFSEKQAKFFMCEILLGFQYLHERDIVYRDIKPENILIDMDGHVRIADFGLSKIIEETQRSYSICGSPEYLSPEMLQSGEGHDRRVDIYCLGVLLYEMLTGLPPFYDQDQQVMFDNILEQEPNIELPYLSHEVQSLLSNMLEKDPVMRYQSVSEIMKHQWFRDVNWRDVLHKKLKPLINPDINSCYFESADDESEHEDSPLLKSTKSNIRRQSYYLHSTVPMQSSLDESTSLVRPGSQLRQIFDNSALITNLNESMLLQNLQTSVLEGNNLINRSQLQQHLLQSATRKMSMAQDLSQVSGSLFGGRSNEALFAEFDYSSPPLGDIQILRVLEVHINRKKKDQLDKARRFKQQLLQKRQESMTRKHRFEDVSNQARCNAGFSLALATTKQQAKHYPLSKFAIKTSPKFLEDAKYHKDDAYFGTHQVESPHFTKQFKSGSQVQEEQEEVKIPLNRFTREYQQVFSDSDACPYIDMRDLQNPTPQGFDDQSPLVGSRERTENYDDSRVLQNVIAEIPSGTHHERRANNSKAHSLDSFRTEPERLEDPPSSSLKSQSEDSASPKIHNSQSFIQGEISKIDGNTQSIQQECSVKQESSSSTLKSYDDYEGFDSASNNELGDMQIEGTQIPKKSKSKRKLLAQSMKIKSMEIFMCERNAIIEKKEAQMHVGRNKGHNGVQPYLQNHQSEKERTDEKMILINDEHQEEELHFDDFVQLGDPKHILSEKARKEGFDQIAQWDKQTFAKTTNAPLALNYRGAAQSNRTAFRAGPEIDKNSQDLEVFLQHRSQGQQTIKVSDLQSAMSPTIYVRKNNSNVKVSMVDSQKFFDMDTPVMQIDIDDSDKLTFGQPNRPSQVSISGSQMSLDNYQVPGSHGTMTKNSKISSQTVNQIKNINFASSLKPVKERVKKYHSKGKGKTTNSQSSHGNNNKELAQAVRSNNVTNSFKKSTTNPRVQIDILAKKKGLRRSSMAKSIGKNSNHEKKSTTDHIRIQKVQESKNKKAIVNPFVSVKPLENSSEPKKSKSLSRIQKTITVLQDHNQLPMKGESKQNMKQVVPISSFNSQKRPKDAKSEVKVRLLHIRKRSSSVNVDQAKDDSFDILDDQIAEETETGSNFVYSQASANFVNTSNQQQNQNFFQSKQLLKSKQSNAKKPTHLVKISTQGMPLHAQKYLSPTPQVKRQNFFVIDSRLPQSPVRDVPSRKNSVQIPVFKADLAKSAKAKRKLSKEVDQRSNSKSTNNGIDLPISVAIDHRKNAGHFSPKNIRGTKTIQSMNSQQSGNPPRPLKGKSQSKFGAQTSLKIDHQKSSDSGISKIVQQSRKNNIITSESNPSSLSMAAQPHIWQRRETPNEPRASHQRRAKARMNNSDLGNTGLIIQNVGGSSRGQLAKQKSGETVQSHKSNKTYMLQSASRKQSYAGKSSKSYQLDQKPINAAEEGETSAAPSQHKLLSKQKSSKSLNLYRRKKPATVTLQLDLKQSTKGPESLNDVISQESQDHIPEKVNIVDMLAQIRPPALDDQEERTDSLMIQKVLTQPFMRSTKIQKDQQASCTSPLQFKNLHQQQQSQQFDNQSNPISKNSGGIPFDRQVRQQQIDFLASVSGSHISQGKRSSQCAMSSSTSLKDQFCANMYHSPDRQIKMTQKLPEKRLRDPMNQNFLGNNGEIDYLKDLQVEENHSVDQKKSGGRGSVSLRDNKPLSHKQPFYSIGACMSLQYMTNTNATPEKQEKP